MADVEVKHRLPNLIFCSYSPDHKKILHGGLAQSVWQAHTESCVVG